MVVSTFVDRIHIPAILLDSHALKDVYLIVKSNPGIKIKQVADARGRSESTVGKQLGELAEKGMIEYRGAKRTGGYYVK